jgi:hypothetical protein
MATGALPRHHSVVAYPQVPGSTTETVIDVTGFGACALEPSIDTIDAEDLCDAPYPSRREALGVARRLRAAGWVVIEHGGRPSYRPDGLSIAASVYHPDTYESPGDLLVPAPRWMPH